MTGNRIYRRYTSIQSHVINTKQKAALNALIGGCSSTKTDERRIWLQKRYFNFRSFVVATPTACNMDCATFSMIPGILEIPEAAMTIVDTTSIVILSDI